MTMREWHSLKEDQLKLSCMSFDTDEDAAKSRAQITAAVKGASVDVKEKLMQAADAGVNFGTVFQLAMAELKGQKEDGDEDKCVNEAELKGQKEDGDEDKGVNEEDDNEEDNGEEDDNEEDENKDHENEPDMAATTLHERRSGPRKRVQPGSGKCDEEDESEEETRPPPRKRRKAATSDFDTTIEGHLGKTLQVSELASFSSVLRSHGKEVRVVPGADVHRVEALKHSSAPVAIHEFSFCTEPRTKTELVVCGCCVDPQGIIEKTRGVAVLCASADSDFNDHRNVEWFQISSMKPLVPTVEDLAVTDAGLVRTAADAHMAALIRDDMPTVANEKDLNMRDTILECPTPAPPTPHGKNNAGAGGLGDDDDSRSVAADAILTRSRRSSTAGGMRDSLGGGASGALSNPGHGQTPPSDNAGLDLARQNAMAIQSTLELLKKKDGALTIVLVIVSSHRCDLTLTHTSSHPHHQQPRHIEAAIRWREAGSLVLRQRERPRHTPRPGRPDQPTRQP